MIATHEILCAVILGSVFFLAWRMAGTTRRDVRITQMTLGTVVALGIAAPLQWTTWRPDWLYLALLAAVAAVEVVTAYHWRHGVPARFVRSSLEPERRTSERRRNP